MKLGEAMYLIAGLGNIGAEYKMTRHNIGFMSVDHISERYNIDINKNKFKGKYGQGLIEGEKVILLKPSTYMNLSGECIQPLMHFFDIAPQNLIVIHDDADIAPAQIRIRKKGSGGTHNGMKNIIQMIGTTDFPRIRIGVGNDKRMDLADYVLSKFGPEEIPLMREAVLIVPDIIKEILLNGIDSAMNKFNPQKTSLSGKEDNCDDSAV